MDRLIQFPDQKGKITTYSGEFVNPYMNSIRFEAQGNRPTCLPTSFRVALQGLGISNLRGIPLNENRRMLNIFKAYGLKSIEEQGAYSEQLIDIINRFPEWKAMIQINPISTDPQLWARAMIENRVIVAGVDSQRFYNLKESDESHALAVLGTSIPAPSEDKDLEFLIFDPNRKQPEWYSAPGFFPTLSGKQYVLSRR